MTPRKTAISPPTDIEAREMAIFQQVQASQMASAAAADYSPEAKLRELRAEVGSAAFYAERENMRNCGDEGTAAAAVRPEYMGRATNCVRTADSDSVPNLQQRDTRHIRPYSDKHAEIYSTVTYRLSHLSTPRTTCRDELCQ